MSRREYPDTFRAEALAALDANDGNVSRTAREIGMPESTLRSWANGVGKRRISAELRGEKRGDLADRLEDIAWKLVNGIDEKDIEGASLVQKTTAFGICVDKMRLLRNQATEISAEASADDLRESILRKLNPPKEAA